MSDTISFEDFTKVDIRIGTIIEVKDFPKANKPAYQLLIDFVKEGHPVPESNLSFELNNGSPEITSTYIPSFLLFQYSLSKAGSVPHL